MNLFDSSLGSDIPCVQIFKGNKGYLYAPSANWCCVSVSNGGTTSTPYDFMDVMTYNGVSNGYSGSYYSGPVHNYTATAGTPAIYFWYLTVADGSANEGMPVE